MKGIKLMVEETPSGDPVCIAIFYPACATSLVRATEHAAVLTHIGIPAWIEEELG